MLCTIKNIIRNDSNNLHLFHYKFNKKQLAVKKDLENPRNKTRKL